MRYKNTYTRRLACLLAATVMCSQISAASVGTVSQKAKVFSDVKEDVWYSDAINKWSERGIITGYEDGSFKPSNPITRAELAVIIDRIFDLQNVEDAKEYKDVNEKAWYQEAISHVSALGLMNDFNGNFHPNEVATREELAFAISKAYKLRGKSDKVFGDQGMIADWAAEAVSALVEGGYILGMPNGDFDPKAPLTRASLMVVVDRLNADIVKESGTLSENIEGNLVISTDNIVLKDMVITGNLYLAGNVKNVTLENCIVNGILINDTGNKCETAFKAGSKVTLEGKFEEIHISKGVDIVLNKDLSIKKLNLIKDTSKDSKPSIITMTEGAVIKELVANEVAEIKGKGEISKVQENVSGVKSSVKPKEIITASGIQSTIGKGNDMSHSGSTSNNKPSNGGGNSGNNNTSKPDNKPTDDVDQSKWQLVWSDEFNGDKVDTSKWDFNTGFMDVNNEKQVYTRENATVSNGTLKITAKKEDTQIGDNTYHYTSSRMVTKGKYAQKYGKIEVRAKLPLGRSLWPAIWMLPENEEYTGWPTSGEIDIMEAKGSVDNKVWGTLHYGDKRPNNLQSGDSYTFPEGEKIDDFHTYGIEWQPGEIRWYIDGKLYQTQNNWNAVDSQTGEKYAFPAPFDKDFHIILNLALGGWYDGVGDNLDVDDSIFANGEEYAMEVDYVRCYESKTGTYPEAIDPDKIVPELPEDARKPLADGNLIYDNTYTNGIQDNKEADKEFGEGWNLLHLNNYNGDATATVDTVNGEPFAKVDISKAGNQNYAIQLVQYTTVGRGRTYKLSYDAKAEGDREIRVKVGGGEERGYGVYSDEYTENLSTQVRHFERTFTMKSNTDTNARLEFNLGLDEKDVWIGNVRLEEVPTPEVVEDFNAPKAPLKNGSLIYNGTFDKGKLDRLTYWNLETKGGSATMNVPETTRDLHINITKGGDSLDAVTVDQQGLRISEDGNYNVQFTASAANDQEMVVKLVGEDGQTVYAQETVSLTHSKKIYELELQAQGKETNKGRLVFEMGGTVNEIILDDISVVEARKDFSGINIKPLINGDFSQGGKGWDGLYIEGGAGNVTFDNEAKFTTTDLGSNPWSVMLQQKDVEFAAGMKYVIAFDASSDIPRDMTVKIEEENTWVTYFEQSVKLDPETQRYTFEFTMPAEKDKQLGLKFLMGNMKGAPTEVHSVTIDNVVCEVKNGALLKSALKNGQFNKGLEGWSTYVENDKAEAAFNVQNKALQIAIDNLGENPWGIQLSQKGVKLEKGKTYEVGFKAHSDERTRFKVAVGYENENYDYTSFLAEDQFFSIDEEDQAYRFTFTMNNEDTDDAKFRIEAGAQEGAVATTIYLDDIYLIEVEGEKAPEDNNTPGQTAHNILSNGHFEEGDKDWNRHAETGYASFSYDNGLNVNINDSGTAAWHISVEQSNIALEKGKTYRIELATRATTASSLRVAIQDNNNGYKEYTGDVAQIVPLTEEGSIYKHEFTVNEETSSNLTFKIQMGYDPDSDKYFSGQNEVVINSVKLYEVVEEENNEVTISLDDFILVEKDTEENLLQDGDFSGHSAWITGGADASFNFDNETLNVAITNPGENPWDVITFQGNVELEGGKTYVLSYVGEASKAKKIKISIEASEAKNHLNYFAKVQELAPNKQAYSYEFTVAEDRMLDSQLEFKLFMGAGIE